MTPTGDAWSALPFPSVAAQSDSLDAAPSITTVSNANVVDLVCRFSLAGKCVVISKHVRPARLPSAGSSSDVVSRDVIFSRHAGRLLVRARVLGLTDRDSRAWYECEVLERPAPQRRSSKSKSELHDVWWAIATLVSDAVGTDEDANPDASSASPRRRYDSAPTLVVTSASFDREQSSHSDDQVQDTHLDSNGEGHIPARSFHFVIQAETRHWRVSLGKRTFTRSRTAAACLLSLAADTTLQSEGYSSSVRWFPFSKVGPHIEYANQSNVTVASVYDSVVGVSGTLNDIVRPLGSAVDVSKSGLIRPLIGASSTTARTRRRSVMVDVFVDTVDTLHRRQDPRQSQLGGDDASASRASSGSPNRTVQCQSSRQESTSSARTEAHAVGTLSTSGLSSRAEGINVEESSHRSASNQSPPERTDIPANAKRQSDADLPTAKVKRAKSRKVVSFGPNQELSQPMNQPRSNDSEHHASQSADAQPASLWAFFHKTHQGGTRKSAAQPVEEGEVAQPEHQTHPTGDVPEASSAQQQQDQEARRSNPEQAVSLNDLPDELLLNIFRHLDPPTLRAVACVCQRLKQLSLCVVPGLLLNLYPHQREAIEWMMRREAGTAPRCPSVLHIPVVARRSGTAQPQVMFYNLAKNLLEDRVSIPGTRSGGMLCDDPGLGKTITMLAFILKMRGIMPPSDPRQVPTLHHRRITAVQDFATQQTKEKRFWVLRTLRELREATASLEAQLRVNGVFEYPVDEDLYPTYRSVVKNPVCYLDIADKAETYSSLDEFEGDLQRVYDNAMAFNPAEHPVHALAKKIKETILPSVLQSRYPSVDEDSTFSRLSGLIPSSATLILVPSAAMVRHWRNQVMLHVDLGLLPRIYAEHAPKQVPSADDLAKHDLVILSFDSVRRADRFRDTIMLVKWQRLVIDEGHKLAGGATTLRSVTSSIIANRTWVMTGTPTPTTSRSTGLKNLLELLCFLEEPPFSGDQKLWSTIVQRPFETSTRTDAVWRLREVIGQIMVRHRKQDLLHLAPEPRRHTVMLDLAPEVVRTYNQLVGAVKANLVLTTMKGEKSHLDSLLHRNQAKRARQVLENARIACCAGLLVRGEVEATDLGETLDMLQAAGAAMEQRQQVARRIQQAALCQPTPCDHCSKQLLVLIILPCGHMFCPLCVTPAVTACPTCAVAFSPDMVQRLQPGVLLKFVDETSSGARASGRLHHTHVFEGIHHMPHDEKETLLRSVDKNHKAKFVIEQLRTLLKEHKEEQRLAPGSSVAPVKVIVYSQFRQVRDLVGDLLYRYFGSKAIAEYTGNISVSELRRFTLSEQCHILLLPPGGAVGLDLSFVQAIFLLDEIWDRSLENQIVARAWRIGASRACHVYRLVSRSCLEETLHALSDPTTSECRRFEEQMATEASESSEVEGTERRSSSSSSSARSNRNSRSRSRHPGVDGTKTRFLLQQLEFIQEPTEQKLQDSTATDRT